MKNTIIALILFLSTLITGCASNGSGMQTAQLRIPKHFIEHKFDGRKWVEDHQAGNDREFISEWIVEGDSVKDWEELLTAHITFKIVNLRQLVSVMDSEFSRNCPSFKSNILDEGSYNLLYEWTHDGCNGYPGQHEIRKFIIGSDGIYALSYVTKDKTYNINTYNKWVKIINAANLRSRSPNN